MSKTEYYASEEDKQTLKIAPGALKLSGDGIFATLQGEGLTAGERAVFLRLHYCNLSCGKWGGWNCDTGYTWDKKLPEFWQEPFNLSYRQTANDIDQAWKEKFGEGVDKRLVVTGGEPLLQQSGIKKLWKLLPEWQLEIETNGTIMPIRELFDAQFNCSPKLANSGNLKNRRYKKVVLQTMNALPNSTFKFVAITPQDLIEVDQIVDDCSIVPTKVLIMPEGHTSDEVAAKSMVLIKEVQARNWRLITRNQLIWFGSKRRT